MDRIKEFKNRFLERTINSEVDEGIDLQGDSLLLQILINNLIENALKYSEKNEAITVGLHRNTDYVKLFVSDQGIGIPEEERQKIYSQFYRIGNEATRKKKGTGLGLYLCAKIAQGHNADILMTNNQPKGSTFVVKFID